MASPQSPSVLVAVTGGSGSGKSWLAGRLHLLLGEIADRVSLDQFYLDRSHLSPTRRESLNYDVPAAIDWPALDRALTAYRAGQPVSFPRYDFITHCRLSDRDPVPPKPLILVEGPWLLVQGSIRNLFDLKVYLDCPARLRLRRRLERDVGERRRSAASVRRHFAEVIAPMHERYVEPQRRHADLVLPMPLKEAPILELADRVWTLLKKGTPLPDWIRATFRAELLNLLKMEE